MTDPKQALHDLLDEMCATQVYYETAGAEACKRLDAEMAKIRGRILALFDAREALAKEQNRPVAWFQAGDVFGGEIRDWEIECNDAVCEQLKIAENGSGRAIPLYTVPPIPSGLIAKEEAARLCEQIGYEWKIDQQHVKGYGAEYLAAQIRALPDHGAQQDAPSIPVAWGHERQDYPGGPIYRVGVSTGASSPCQPQQPVVTDEMVNRFLRWRLPEDFQPDCGISFTPDYNQHTPWPAKHKPVGTNLFTAEQARKMLEFVLAVEARPCTCHPSDNPPVPCPRKYALQECRETAGQIPKQPQDMVLVPRETLEQAEKYRRISSPEIKDFLRAVENEALHQRERWGSDHDAGKTAEDWLWLVAYLTTKAAQASRYHDQEKYLHHIITCAAATLNWHAQAMGSSTLMRPGQDDTGRSAMLAAGEGEK